MLRSDASSDASAAGGGPRFVLYVEGPRDREILQIWARRLSSRMARSLESSCVILGGRQPARALEHFRTLGGSRSGVGAVCVLDRDGHGDASHDAIAEGSEPGLQFFTWPRRHIESYLLVRRAISQCLGAHCEEWLVTQLLDEHIPDPSDERALRELDAKRLLAAKGPIAQGSGQALRPSWIARTMREAEIHEDVLTLLSLIRGGLGLREPERYLVAK